MARPVRPVITDHALRVTSNAERDKTRKLIGASAKQFVRERRAVLYLNLTENARHA